jgi:hypothetical protein
MTKDEAQRSIRSFYEAVNDEMPDDGAWTGSATRKPRLLGGDQGRNEKTNIFLTGKPRPVGGGLPFYRWMTGRPQLMRLSMFL